MNEPQNLVEVINRNLEGYKLMFGYSLEIDHGLLGYFPAYVEGTDPKQIVYCTDLDILKEIWNSMEPEKSKIRTEMYYVDSSGEKGFPLIFNYGGSLNAEKSVPDIFVTSEKLKKLLEHKKAPFLWAEGVIGSTWSPEYFKTRIDEAIKRAKEERGLMTVPA